MPRHWSATFLYLSVLTSVIAVFLRRPDLAGVAILLALLAALIDHREPSRKGRPR